MTSQELRQTFLKFFEEKGHKIAASSSLLPSDPSVLFTTAGMQQFKPYFLGEKSPYGNRVASCQKCFRTSDIEEVGDNRHLTFLEMLGNFSFGDYFKEEAIKLAKEFLIENCKLKIENLWVTYFQGDGEVPQDFESRKIWQDLGIPADKIFGFGRADNFWGPTGTQGPCGPTSEIHYDITQTPCPKGKRCIPNCECGRFLELWNLVFNEYYQDEQKKLTPLKQQGVDTGMGLERLAMAWGQKSSVYDTDLFGSILDELNSYSLPESTQDQKVKRIIADHVKGIVFLIADGIFPSNIERGYVLRRLLRRVIRYGKLLNCPQGFLIPLAQKAIGLYRDVYPEVALKEPDILTVIQKEQEQFSKALERGQKELKMQVAKCAGGILSGKIAFDLYQSYGFPLDLTEELAREQDLKVDREGFFEAQKRHQVISRTGAEKKFGGHGLVSGVSELRVQDEREAEIVTRLHTATHLLHGALREVLGPHVKQMGSDITVERLRFDFSHPKKLTEEETRKVERLVNKKISENLVVKKEEMRYEDALKAGALAFFKEKYPEKVTVYTIENLLDPSGQAFSKEICGGPHVNSTSELHRFRILKEETVGTNIRRIRAVVG